MATTKKAAKKSAPEAKTGASKYIRNPAVRRPAQNEVIKFEDAQEVSEELENVRTLLENFAAHLRALDRARLNGVGAKKRGFIGMACGLAEKTPEMLPYWITVAKFKGDIELFDELNSLSDLCRQVMELAWNMRMIAADMAYTDALEFYTYVREAAKRRVDAAEAVFEEMRKFFKSHGNRGIGRTTEKELMRDAKAVERGRKEGKIVIENIKPKLVGGKKKIIDKTWKSDVKFQDEEDGEISK